MLPVPDDAQAAALRLVGGAGDRLPLPGGRSRERVITLTRADRGSSGGILAAPQGRSVSEPLGRGAAGLHADLTAWAAAMEAAQQADKRSSGLCVAKISAVLTAAFPDAKVALFGSRAAGLQARCARLFACAVRFRCSLSR